MLRILVVSISLLLCISSVFASSPSERQFEILYNVHVEGEPHSVISPGYLIYYPENYETQSSENFPVVLFLHGAGERGASPSILASKSSFLPGMVNNNVNFPFIVVSPLARWSMDSLSQAPYLEQIMAHVRANNRIDITREYVAGLSQGGKGARRYAESHADTIAGLVSAAGYGGGSNIQGLVDNNVPIILSHNENDGTISFNSSVGYHNKLVAAGATDIIFDIAPTGGHNAWGRVFSNMTYWDWLLSIPNEVSGVSLTSAISIPAILATNETVLTILVEVIDTLGDPAGIDYVNIDLAAIGVDVVAMSHQTANTYVANISLATPLPAGQYELIITAVDFEGNEKSVTYTLTVEVPPNDAPTVAILTPENGVHTVEGDVVTFSIQADDSDGSIQRIELYVNNSLSNTALIEPYDISVADLAVGLHSIYVVAIDDLGSKTQTESINVIVDYLNPPPEGSERILDITGAGRAEGSSYFPTELAFDAQPSYLDQGLPELVSGGGKAPYYQERVGYIDFGDSWFDYRISKVWTLYSAWSNGTQTPYAELWWDNDIDTNNNSGFIENNINFNSASNIVSSREAQWVLDGDFTSEPIIPKGRYLMLRAPSPMSGRALEYALVGWKQSDSPIGEAPSVSITSPSEASEFSVNEIITFTVNSSDDGIIEKIEYYADDTLLGSSTIAPFSFETSFTGVGTNNITAVAYDDSGLSTTSDVVSVHIINEVIRLIQPVDAGKAEGGKYFPMEFSFDTPPSYQNGELGLLNEGSQAPYYSGRYGYIDFGDNWANIQILQTHTLYRSWSGGDQTPYAEIWWDDDKDTVNDGITEDQINFNSAVDLVSFNESQWVKDSDLTENPVTPKGRYLLLKAPQSMTARALEYAIIGR